MKVWLRLCACAVVLLPLGGCSLFIRLDPQFTAEELWEERPLTVVFDASISSPAPWIVGYQWDFGDGADGSGVTTTHTYAEHGVYPVTLTVTNRRGETAVVGRDVVVMGRPPRGSFFATARTDGQRATASFVCLFYGCPSGPCSFIIDFGDGESEAASGVTGFSTKHTYEGLGPYTVRVTITDRYGRSSSSTKIVTGSSLPRGAWVIDGTSPASVAVGLGETLLIRLAGNPTTGALWERVGSHDPSVLRPVGDDYTGDPACAGRAGCGGFFGFRYEAVGVGSTQVDLVYWRPWERQPIQEFSRTLVVVEGAGPASGGR